jgi:RNA polymerase sigma factor (sigma-70 family)
MTSSPDTRASLIVRLRCSEDVDAWGEFVDIYQPLIFRVAKKHGLQDADASEVAQEVLTRVAKAIDRWNPDPERGTFRGWLYRITRNLTVEFLRTDKRRPLTQDNSAVDRAIGNVVADSNGASREFQIEYERQMFAWAAEQIETTFQSNTWQAFWLTAVKQQSVESVAKKLSMTKGAVYIARSRVMAKLKEQIQLRMNETNENI